MGKDSGDYTEKMKKKADELGITLNVLLRYAPKGTLMDVRVAEDIEKDMMFVCPTDTKILYRYNEKEGIYTDDGEVAVETWLSEHIEPLIKKGTREEIIQKIRIRHYTDPCLVNSAKDLIIMENGIYNIIDGTFSEHTDKIISTAKIPVIYKPKAKCDKIDKFIRELVYEKDVETIYEILGYCLCRDYPIRKAFIFYGETKNGKTALINLMQKFLGNDNTMSVPLHQLERDQWSVKSLAGKMANLCADISGEALETSSRFRELVGNDRITVRTMRSEGMFMFKNYAKLIFSANRVPTPTDDLNSFYNRILTITFPNTFDGDSADPDIVRKIATENELSGLFLKCVESLKMLLERRKFTGTLSDELNKEQYKRMCNPMQAFLDDFFEPDMDSFMAIEDFQQLLNTYLLENGLPLMTDKKIYSVIQTVSNFNLQKYRPMRSGDRKRGISGMKLKDGVGRILEMREKDSGIKLESFLENENTIETLDEEEMSESAGRWNIATEVMRALIVNRVLVPDIVTDGEKYMVINRRFEQHPPHIQSALHHDYMRRR